MKSKEPPMGDLFGYKKEPEPGLARSSNPSTSHLAAKYIDASKLEEKVLQIVKRYGPPRGRPMCVVEIHAKLPELSIDSISPRMKQLVKKGFLRCVGREARANRHGNTRSQQIYEAIK